MQLQTREENGLTNKKGYRAVCINVGNTVNLEKYEEYYVYPNGENTYYVSRFPYPERSLLGCYDKLFFKVLEEVSEKVTAEPEAAPVVELEAEPENFEQISLF